MKKLFYGIWVGTMWLAKAIVYIVGFIIFLLVIQCNNEQEANDLDSQLNNAYDDGVNDCLIDIAKCKRNY